MPPSRRGRSLDGGPFACQSCAVKSCGPSGSQDLAFKEECPDSTRRDHSEQCPRRRFLERQLHRGLPGVYETVISGHRESPPVQRIRCNEAPEVTGGDSSRQLPITRNEGPPVRVRASALPDLQGLSSVWATLRARSGYETGTSSDRFTVSEGVPALRRFRLICRHVEAREDCATAFRSARKCPRVDARVGASWRSP